MLRDKKFLLLLVVYLFYAIFFIYKTSVVINGERYFIIHDDVYISMQYAKNFVKGNGLVWSIGNKVEGFTNPLWTFYIIIPHSLKIPPSKIPLFLQLTNLFFMLLTLILVWKISKNYIAIFFTAFFYSMNYWFYNGFEVGVLTFLSIYVIYKIIKNDSPLIIYLLCAVMTFVRIDMFLFFFAVIVFYRKDFKTGILIFLSAFILQTLIRYIFYGDIFPNTYYSKLYKYPLHYRLLRSTVALANNLYHMNFLVFALPFLMFKFLDEKSKLFLYFVLLQFLYTIYIGGDVWELFGGTNRFVTMVMPLFFIVFVKSYEILMEKIEIKNKFIFYFLLLAIFINMNAIKDLKSIKNLFSQTYDAAVGSNTLKIALFIKKNFDENVLIATQGAGVLPYFSDKKYYIDLLGKNDKYIARSNIIKFSSPYQVIISAPGHIKYNQEYSIISKKPDIIVHHIHDGKIEDYLIQNYVEIDKKGFKDVWIKKEIFYKNNNWVF